MPVFNYEAVTENGKAHKGILEGDSVSHVRKALNDRGLIPIEITLVNGGVQKDNARESWISYFSHYRKRIPTSDLAVISYQFSTLLTAGISVDEALASMVAEITSPGLKQVLLGVRSKVLEGNTLANSMNEYPMVFPKLYVSSVAVGERTGQLDNVLYRLADYYESQRAVREKIVQALIYPTLLTLVAGAIVLFLLIYVMPQVAGVFIETGQDLPGITQFLLSVADYLKNFGLYILLFLVMIIFLFKYSLKNFAFKRRVQLLLLKIPFLNQAIIAVNSASFLRTLGILFAAGVPVLDAMTSANNVVSLIPMCEAIREAVVTVGEGASIHQSLQKTGYFSPLSIQLVASGEMSGKLEVMLEKAAAFQERSTANKLNTVLALFEPILILIMGCIVLFIVLAVLLPIFDMNQSIQ